MDILASIKITEEEFPKLFSKWEEREYGILYYDEDNKASHDSNHVVLFSSHDHEHLENALIDIYDFYSNKGIIPRIYHPYIHNFFEKNIEIFQKKGYELTFWGENNYMLLTADNNIKITNRLHIKKLNQWDERIAKDILVPINEEYEVKILKDNFEKFSVFVGYINNEAVSLLYFHTSKYGCTRFDYIVTAKLHRGMGYAREILSHVVNYCKANHIINCYQWPINKTSEDMCYEAGFRRLYSIEAAEASYKII